jgi:hypothetical protein
MPFVDGIQLRFEVAHPDFLSPGPAPPGGPAVEVPGIPPFAKYAKDGAPWFYGLSNQDHPPRLSKVFYNRLKRFREAPHYTLFGDSGFRPDERKTSTGFTNQEVD